MKVGHIGVIVNDVAPESREALAQSVYAQIVQYLRHGGRQTICQWECTIENTIWSAYPWLASLRPGDPVSYRFGMN